MLKPISETVNYNLGGPNLSCKPRLRIQIREKVCGRNNEKGPNLRFLRKGLLLGTFNRLEEGKGRPLSQNFPVCEPMEWQEDKPRVSWPVLNPLC